VRLSFFSYPMSRSAYSNLGFFPHCFSPFLRLSLPSNGQVKEIDLLLPPSQYDADLVDQEAPLADII